MPGIGSQASGLINKAVGVADTVAKLQPLFAPKVSEKPPTLGDARQAEKAALGESLRLPSKVSEVTAYPSSRSAAEQKERENARLTREFDDALTREQDARRPIRLDDRAPASPGDMPTALPVPSPAAGKLPASPETISQAFQAIRAVAPAASGEAAATAGSAASSAGAMAMAALPVAGPVALSVAATFAEYKALEFANSTARRIGNEAEQQIAGLSPEVAMAQAQEQLNQLQANFRTSERLGDEVAGMIENRSAISNELQDIRDKIGEPLLQFLNKQSDALARILQVINNSSLFNGGVGTLKGMTATLESQLALMARWLPELKKEPKGGNVFSWYDQQEPVPLPAPFNGDEEFVDGKIDNPALQVN